MSWVGGAFQLYAAIVLLPPSLLSDTHKHERRCAHAYMHEFKKNKKKTWLIRDFLCVRLAKSQSTVKGPVCATC